MLPKVQTADQVVALTRCSRRSRRRWASEVGKIGIEAQIENAQGLKQRERDRRGAPARARRSSLGPADFSGLHQHEVPSGRRRAAALATARTPTTTSLTKILMAARANDPPGDRTAPTSRSRTWTASGRSQPRRRPGLRRQVGAARPGRRGQRGLLPPQE
ncbi:hypothetical protein [Streptomyces sp. KL116D]|uniref:hypothetical protein n=1 Tax=Streptomyces sp. KL116D TaxID=3045152 RepID=UPI003556C453